MNMSLQNNLAAMNANRMFNITGNKRTKSAEKLSSGYRINRAADDAAGLAISEKMRRQVKGLNQASRNIQDGVSLCQVADGALSEVHEMLHRLEELSVQSANDTNSYEDRQYIQQETNKILQEIDRIGDETTFNEIPVFKGRDIPVYEDDGTPVIEGDIPTSKFKLADVSLGLQPFTADSPAGELNLKAIVTDDTSNANGVTIPLIYGNGGTSYSSIRFTNRETGEIKTVQISEMTVSSYSEDPSEHHLNRQLTYDNNGLSFSIRQQLTVADSSGDQKGYQLLYRYLPSHETSSNYSAQFMFNMDTAYGGNGAGDRRESYYVGGQKLSENTVYVNGNSSAYNAADYAGKDNVVETDGSFRGFSIYGIADESNSNQLQFTEFVSAVWMPDVISVGQYYKVDKWENYTPEKISGLSGSTMEGPSRSEDLAFSMIWDLDSMGNRPTVGLTFGIQPAATDPNIDPNDISYSRNIIQKHESDNPVYIQAGVEAGHGIYVHTREMNSRVLGIEGLNLTTSDGTQDGIPRIKRALQEVSDHRSTMGAQQNRLEHAIKIDDNTAENTQYAESQIRDTDMATEMVEYSNHGILEQAGTSMLTQANQSRQGLLSLLQ